MAKHSRVVGLALLGCLLATLIEAQLGGQWRERPKTGQTTSKRPLMQTPPAPVLPVPPKPQKPQTPVVTTNACEVEVVQRVPCGYPEISAQECDAIGCCFDRQSCYYGKAVTVQCTKDGQFIVVVSRDATLPNIDLDSITMLGEHSLGDQCTPIDSNSAFAIYQFPVTNCGTLVKEESGVIIYENRMASSYEVGVGPRGAITRDTTYELLFQCRYIGNSVETLVYEGQGSTPPSVIGYGDLGVVLRLGNGQCIAKGCIEEEMAYSSYYTLADYPVEKVLRDAIYVDVSIVDRTDQIHITLGHCWTTINPNPHSLPQWDLLINGCPYRDDRYMTTLVHVDADSAGVSAYPSHHKRFIFQMFTFVDGSSRTPLREHVYIHCSTTVCTSDCEPDCVFRGKRHARAAAALKKSPMDGPVHTVGPVYFTRESDMSTKNIN